MNGVVGREKLGSFVIVLSALLMVGCGGKPQEVVAFFQVHLVPMTGEGSLAPFKRANGLT